MLALGTAALRAESVALQGRLVVLLLLLCLDLFIVLHEVVLMNAAALRHVTLRHRTVLRRGQLGHMTVDASVTARGGHHRLGRVLTELLEALAAAHSVPVEPELLQVRFLVGSEACPVYALPVLFLDDEGGCVPARQARDHTGVQELLGGESQEVFVAFHVPFEGIDALCAVWALDHAFLAPIV